MSRREDSSVVLSRASEPFSYSQARRASEDEVLGAPLGTNTASTIIWYISICVLFIVAFVSLVLSLLYFLNDSTKEQVIKLYGITGAGSLAIITFVIIFLDCCNDEDREDHEEEAIYRILQVKEKKDKELIRKRKRLRAAKKAEKVNGEVATRHQHSPVKHSAPAPTCHHYHYPAPHHVHHIHTHSTPTYRPQYYCNACHDLHAPNPYRPYKADAAVDTSDKIFDLMLKANRPVSKATHDVQTDSSLFKSPNELQTDRKETKQTSPIIHIQTPPRNLSDLSRETTFSKGSRNTLPPLHETSEQLDNIDAQSEHLSVVNTEPLTVSDV